MSTTPGRVAVLTEEHLEQLLTQAAARGAQQAMTASRQERVLKVSEVARRLSCAPSTVYGLIERGHLPALRLGSAVRVLESALDTWVRAHLESERAP